ncbi:MAG: SDR family oxidoreductase [Caulobacterales bacterium]|nr:SDR family oxidoreductase [Caulobacterales bacterium]
MAGGRLKGKSALITGGASGIGAASAARFVEEGAKVALTDIDVDKGAALARSLGEAAAFIALDVTDEASWRAAVPAAEAALGPLTTIVNSAGVSVPATIEDVSFEAFKALIDINLNGVFLGCKYGLNAIKAQSGAAIVNVGSTLGVRGSSLFPAYCASKGGVRMLSKSVAAHCAEQGYGVRVNCVLPGAIHTEMVDRYIANGVAAGTTREAVIDGFASVHPMKRLGRPQEPADAIVYLASDESSFTTGADLPVDGGFLL